MMLREVAKEDRPRERLIKYGVSSLTNKELLSIILKSGTKNKSVYELSNEILSKLTFIGNLKDFKLNSLLEIKGIGNSGMDDTHHRQKTIIPGCHFRHTEATGQQAVGQDHHCGKKQLRHSFIVNIDGT